MQQIQVNLRFSQLPESLQQVLQDGGPLSSIALDMLAANVVDLPLCLSKIIKEYPDLVLTIHYQEPDKLVVSGNSVTVAEVTFMNEMFNHSVCKRQSSDPLSNSPFLAETSIVNNLVSEINANLRTDILVHYHSNVLPVIGSTGIGKTRSMIELCMNRERYNLPSTITRSYFALPRYDGETILSSWPSSCGAILNFINSGLGEHLSVMYDPTTLSVLLCSVLLVAGIKQSTLTTPQSTWTAEDWHAYHVSIANESERLWANRKSLLGHDDIKRFSNSLLDELSIGTGEDVVVFCDEAGTLVDYSITSNRIHSWNLYRSMRHAARNLHHLLEERSSSFLLVVSGTQSKLANFHHLPQKAAQYRPTPTYEFALRSFICGKSITPVTVVPRQMDVSKVVPGDRVEGLSKYLSVGLSFRLAVSMRPLWLSYYVIHGPSSAFFTTVVEKVQTSLRNVRKKNPSVEYHGEPVHAILQLFSTTSLIPESILSALVESSFGNITHKLTVADSDIFFSAPLLDPLVAAACWSLFRNSRPTACFDYTIEQIVAMSLFTGYEKGSLELLSESVACMIFLNIIDKHRMNSSTRLDAVSLKTLLESGDFHHQSLEDYGIATQEYSQWQGPLEEWFVNANHPIRLPLRIDPDQNRFPNNTVIQKQFYKVIVIAWMLRHALLMPSKWPGCDFIIPVLRIRSGNALNVVSILEKVEQGVFTDIAIVKVQVKSSDFTHMFNKCTAFVFPHVPSLSVGMLMTSELERHSYEKYVSIQVKNSAKEIEYKDFDKLYFVNQTPFPKILKMLTVLFGPADESYLNLDGQV
ncbi:hypothetical protein RCL1_007484 [Eukaryota sp. TZLM3-RCL]